MYWYATAKVAPNAPPQNILMAAFANNLLFYIALLLSICSTAYSDELDAASDFACPMTKDECPALCKKFKSERPMVCVILTMPCKIL